MTSARVWLLPLFVTSLSCAHHVRLENPDTTGAGSYTCKAGPQATCAPSQVLVPAEENRAGTAFVILPRQCAGRIHRIVILNADSSEPEVNVTCAPNEESPSEPISEAR